MPFRFSFKDAPIRYKLLLLYGLLFLLALCISIASILYFSMRAIRADAENELTNTTDTLHNMVTTTMDAAIRANLSAVAHKNREIAAMMHRRAEQAPADLSPAEAKTRTARIFLAQSIGSTGYLYAIDSQGIIRVHPHPELMGADLTRHAFIREQLARKEGYIEYEWKNPGETDKRPKALFMTYFGPWDWIISASAYRDEFLGMVGPETFRDEVLSIRIGETGYPYIIDSAGNLIIHPRLEGENIYDSQDKDGRYFIREICRRKSGQITYPWKNPGEDEFRKKMVVFRHIPEFDWIIASSAYYEEFYSVLHTNLTIIGLTALLVLILLIPLTLWINSRLVRGLDAAADAANHLSRCDLSVSVNSRNRDEIGRLLSAVAVMLENLRSVIARATDVAAEVNASVAEMAGSLSEQAAVATQQAASVSEISSTMEEFSASSTQISENAGSVVEIADDTLTRTREGVDSVEAVMGRMVKIDEDNQQGIRQILALRKKTDEIAKVMEIINTIADQTKLIAFNAAIEAAGAGESGKRFSVVAVEIRRLADNVMASTGEIESKIHDIQSTTERIVVSSEKNTKGIREALDAFSQTVDLLKNILTAAQTTVDAARQISHSTRQQKTASEQVVTALREIDEGTNQTSESISHISGISQTLSGLSEELDDLMSRFKLPGGKAE